MEFIQEPALKVFLALALSFFVVKIILFVVSNTTNTAASADGYEGSGVTKEVKVGKSIVRFVNDVLVGRVNCFEGFVNQVLLDDDCGDGSGRMMFEVDVAVVGGNLGKNVVDQLVFHGLVGDSRGELGQEDLDKTGDSCAMDDEGCGRIVNFGWGE